MGPCVGSSPAGVRSSSRRPWLAAIPGTLPIAADLRPVHADRWGPLPALTPSPAPDSAPSSLTAEQNLRVLEERLPLQPATPTPSPRTTAAVPYPSGTDRPHVHGRPPSNPRRPYQRIPPRGIAAQVSDRVLEPPAACSERELPGDDCDVFTPSFWGVRGRVISAKMP